MAAYERRDNPDFSWSNSRKALFDYCKRAYYYKYYGAHNGWEKHASYEAIKAYFLKNALSLPLAFEKSVQSAIRQYFDKINDNNEMGKETFSDIIKKNLHGICVKASDIWACEANPKNNPMLIEKLNYKDGFKSPKVKESIDKIKKQFNTVTNYFYSSPTVQEIKNGSEIIENFEDFNRGSFMLKGREGELLTIWGKADTIHKVGNKYIATLWLTDTSTETIDKIEKEFHAQVIIIYMSKRYQLKAKDVEVRIYELDTGMCSTYSLKSKEQNTIVLKTIAKSIKEMSEYMENKDIQTNKALPMNTFTQKENHINCRQCQFCELCVEEAKKKNNTTEPTQVA